MDVECDQRAWKLLSQGANQGLGVTWNLVNLLLAHSDEIIQFVHRVRVPPILVSVLVPILVQWGRIEDRYWNYCRTELSYHESSVLVFLEWLMARWVKNENWQHFSVNAADEAHCKLQEAEKLQHEQPLQTPVEWLYSSPTNRERTSTGQDRGY